MRCERKQEKLMLKLLLRAEAPDRGLCLTIMLPDED